MSRSIRMMVTFYGFNDNDPPSADIAYPRLLGIGFWIDTECAMHT
jgi:hypothetical protein